VAPKRSPRDLIYPCSPSIPDRLPGKTPPSFLATDGNFGPSGARLRAALSHQELHATVMAPALRPGARTKTMADIESARDATVLLIRPRRRLPCALSVSLASNGCGRRAICEAAAKQLNTRGHSTACVGAGFSPARWWWSLHHGADGKTRAFATCLQCEHWMALRRRTIWPNLEEVDIG